MRVSIHRLLTLVLLSGLCAGPAFASELSEKGRDVFNKNRRAVVTLQVVLKTTGPRGSQENRLEITGTIVDPSGLTVVALSACDPTEINRRLSEDYKVDSEVSDLKILLEDSTELPVEIVLRDKDLDLAFIRPKTKPASPLTAVDLTQSTTGQVLDEVIALNRLNKAASRAYSASLEHITAVVQKPRTFYIPDNTMSSTTLGSPAFALDGKILGIYVLRAISATGGNVRESLTPIILPAEDVLKGAKQAPQAKGDGEKKEESKEPAKESKDGAEKK